MRRGAGSRRGNLRAPASTLAGRAKEIAAVLGYLEERNGAVTLTGPGGVGKTRVAIEAAIRWSAATTEPRSVWFCDLSAARDLESVLQDIANTLGIESRRVATPDAAIDGLGAALARRSPALVVLDNAEQVVDAVASIVDRWMQGAGPDACIVTTRERLRVAGERAIELGPLPIRPERDGEMSDAARLLADRVSSARNASATRGAELQMLDAIARRIEGMPLSIEIAARRVASLGAAAVLASSLDVGAGALRGSPARHASLRDTIEWSWRWLDDDERAVLAQCSVFAGSFDGAAAAVVARTERRSTSDVLVALREKSLLREYEADDVGGVRYGFYVSIQEYAAERLAERGAAAARARHASWCAALAESLASLRHGPRHAASMTRLRAELANFRSAIEHGLAADASSEAFQIAARIAVALEPSLLDRGSYLWLLDILERMLRSTLVDALPVSIRGRLLAARASARQMAGRPEEVQPDLDAALELAEQSGDLRLELGVMLRWNHFATSIGDSSKMQVTADRALALGDATGERQEQPELLGRLAIAESARNDNDAAIRHADLAIAIARTNGDVVAEATAEQVSGYCHFDRGLLEPARTHFERARDLALRAGATLVQGIAVANLGSIAIERGDDDGAIAQYDHAIETLGEAGAERPAATARGYRSLVAFQRRRFGEAYASLAAAHDQLGGNEQTMAGAFFGGWLSLCELAIGRVEQGERRLERLRSCWADRDNTLPVVARIQSVLAEAFRAERLAHSGNASAALAAERAACETLRAACPTRGVTFPEDVRLSLRVAQRATASAQLRLEIATLLGEPTPVLVAIDGAWFQPDGSARVDCSRIGPAKRALALLARARVATPGRVVGSRELVAGIWPGEKILRSAAANRLRVALAKLRAAGARAWLLTRDDGYLLDPATPFELVPN